MSRFHQHEWDLLPEQAFRPRLGRFGGMTLEGKGGGSPPPPDPRFYANLEKQTALAEEMWDFSRTTLYNDNKERQAKNDALNEKTINQNLDLSAKAGARADDAWNFYLNKGRPVVEQSFKDAQEYDSVNELANARGRAAATTTAAFDNSQRQNNRALQRMGVSPDSGRFLALNNQMALQKATATAGAMNAADEGRRAGAIAMRQQAGNMAQGMPAQSQGFSGQSGGFGSAASNIGASGMSGAMAIGNQAIGGMNSATSQFGNAANSYNSMYGNQLQGYQIQSNNDNSFWGGMGSLAGTAMSVFADGGVVGVDGKMGKNEGGGGGALRGPGTGTSDSIDATNTTSGEPVRLSSGEYIIPKRVVDAKGKEFFDRMISKYHKPDGKNLGRA